MAAAAVVVVVVVVVVVGVVPGARCAWSWCVSTMTSICCDMLPGTLQLIWLVGITQMLFIVLHDVDWLVTRKIKLEPEQCRPQDTMAAVVISEHE